jgi:hypothetical protein
MIKTFNLEEETRLSGIVDDYRTIYDRAAFLAVQMEKMELEMAELLGKMEGLRDEETSIYAATVERTGIELSDVKTAATQLILAKQGNLVENS